MLKLDESKNLNNEDYFNSIEFKENSIRRLNTEKEDKNNYKKRLIKNTGYVKVKMLFAIRFEYLCNKKGIITGKKAKEVLGISYPTFSKYKSGESFPSIDELIRLTDLLNVSLEYLIGATDSTNALPPKMNMKLGLSEKAKINLYKIYHYVQDDVQDVTIHLPHSNLTVELLENFSSFIENFSDFCDFLTYTKRYVEVKQEINKLEENKENTLDYLGTKEHLTDLLIRN